MALFALFGFIVLGLLTLFFFNFHKFYNRRKTKNESPDEIEKAEERILPEGNFQPVPSVTENSTELLNADLLKAEQKTRKFE